MILVDFDDTLVGDVRSDDFFRVLEMQHFKQHQSIHDFLCHRLFAADSYFFDFVGIFGVQLLLLFFASPRDIHVVEDDLSQSQWFLVDRSELIIH